MQPDMFAATAGTAGGLPVFNLPLTVRVRSAERISETEIRSGFVVGKGTDATGVLCRCLVALGVPETHLQVYDGRVACYFGAIADMARSPGCGGL